jgi:hypothetical protein
MNSKTKPLLYIHEDGSRNVLTELYFSETDWKCKTLTSVKEALDSGIFSWKAVLIDQPLSSLFSDKTLARFLNALGDGVPVIVLFDTTDRSRFEKLQGLGIKHFFPSSKTMDEKLQFLNSV